MPTILITAVNRGIGRALAELYLARGWRVIGTVRDLTRDGGARQLADEGRLKLIALDVRDEASISAAANAVDEPLDALINNAGVIGPDRQSPLDMDFDGFADTLNINVLGPLRIVQAFLPQLRRAKSARILTISSRMGSHESGKSNRIAYRASKAAVNRLMQGLATDLAGEGIAVCVAHPGWVQTDMGGSGADISAQESAAGLARLIDGLSLKNTGAFYNYDGSTIPW